MAGGLTISTLNDSSGVLATQNGMSGIAKAWVNFNGTGTVAIRASFNVSSITDNGTGQYTVNFITAMPDANYAPMVTCSDDGILLSTANVLQTWTTYATTTSCRVVTNTNAGGGADRTYVGVAVFR